MPLTYSNLAAVTTADGAGSTIVRNSVSCVAGNLLTVIISNGDSSAENVAGAMSSDGTAITWSVQQSSLVANNCGIRKYQGIAGATPPTTLTYTANGTSSNPNTAKLMMVIVEDGQHATTPTPAGNYFTADSATTISRSITPTASGSDIWLFAADWNDANTFAAAANCTLVYAPRTAGIATWALVRATTQPRPDGAEFTIGSTSAGAKNAWIAWEVQAAAGAAATSIPPRRVFPMSILQH